MFRPFILLVALAIASPALAAKIAIIDFQRAVNETTEGKNAQKQLEQMYASRKGEIDRQKGDLQKALEQYEQTKIILNDEARQAMEADIMSRQGKLQQDILRYEQEMQVQYQDLVMRLDNKMRELSGTIAKEKGYDLVLDKAAVVYAGGEAVDMTNELIVRYNAK